MKHISCYKPDGEAVNVPIDDIFAEMRDSCNAVHSNQRVMRDFAENNMNLDEYTLEKPSNEENIDKTNALKFIHEHINDPELNLERVASNCFISRCHLSRKFIEWTGQGFKQHVIKARLEEALRLIQGGMSVTETCYQVGYGDLTHFGRMFKRVHGYLPSTIKRAS
jgi:AraC-like DNA-binding protein